jgi:hypothetical protein
MGGVLIISLSGPVLVFGDVESQGLASDHDFRSHVKRFSISPSTENPLSMLAKLIFGITQTTESQIVALQPIAGGRADSSPTVSRADREVIRLALGLSVEHTQQAPRRPLTFPVHIAATSTHKLRFNEVVRVVGE